MYTNELMKKQDDITEMEQLKKFLASKELKTYHHNMLDKSTLQPVEATELTQKSIDFVGRFIKKSLEDSKDKVCLKNCILKDETMRSLNCKDLAFINCEFENYNFKGCSIEGAEFIACTFYGCSWDHMNMSGAVFCGCDFSGNTIQNSILDRTVWMKTDFDRANITTDRNNPNKCSVDDLVIFGRKKLMSWTECLNSLEIGKLKDLKNCKFIGETVTVEDLKHFYITNSEFEDCNFERKDGGNPQDFLQIPNTCEMVGTTFKNCKFMKDSVIYRGGFKESSFIDCLFEGAFIRCFMDGCEYVRCEMGARKNNSIFSHTVFMDCIGVEDIVQDKEEGNMFDSVIVYPENGNVNKKYNEKIQELEMKCNEKDDENKTLSQTITNLNETIQDYLNEQKIENQYISQMKSKLNLMEEDDWEQVLKSLDSISNNNTKVKESSEFEEKLCDFIRENLPSLVIKETVEVPIEVSIPSEITKEDIVRELSLMSSLEKYKILCDSENADTNTVEKSNVSDKDSIEVYAEEDLDTNETNEEVNNY